MEREKLISQKLKLESKIRSIQKDLDDINSKIASIPEKYMRLEVGREGRKWNLHIGAIDVELPFNTLADLTEMFMTLRDRYYRKGLTVELYDRDKKVLHREFHRILKLLTEELPSRESTYKRQLKYRMTGTQRTKPPKKHEPKTLRPILREERTW